MIRPLQGGNAAVLYKTSQIQQRVTVDLIAICGSIVITREILAKIRRILETIRQVQYIRRPVQLVSCVFGHTSSRSDIAAHKDQTGEV
jgi:hypothetical protein